MRCTALNRVCRNPDVECGYRFPAGDKSTHCPKCGFERRCRKDANEGYKVCRMHGGGSPKKGRIPGRPPKDGVFSYYLPKRMVKDYDQALADERLTELRADIALLEARRADLIRRAEEGESGELWEQLVKAWFNYWEALHGTTEEEEKIANMLAGKLNWLFTRAKNDFSAWKEIETITDQLHKTRNSENRRLKEMQQMISVEKMMALMGKIIGVIEGVVDDRRQKTAIALGIKGLLEVGNTVDGEWKEITD